MTDTTETQHSLAYRIGSKLLRWGTQVTPAEQLRDAEETIADLLVQQFYLQHDLLAERGRSEAAMAFAMDLDEELTAERQACAQLEARVGELVVNYDEQRHLNDLLLSAALTRDALDAKLAGS